MKVTDTRLAGVRRIELDVFGDERGYFMESFQARRYAAVLGAASMAADRTSPAAEASQDTAGGGLPPGMPFFVQDNSSCSGKGVLRGLHFQRDHPQGKLIHVSHGRVFDVAVDLRRDSPTFGQWEGMVLQGAGPHDGDECEAGTCVAPSVLSERAPAKDAPARNTQVNNASATVGASRQPAAPLVQLWIPAGFAHGFAVLSDVATVHYKCTDYYYPDDQVCLHWNDPDLAIGWPVSDPILSRRDSQGESFSSLLQRGVF
jgi:dTDP-4-dehydrorhamnose 3,5-epimerase